MVDEAQVDTNITQKELEALLIYDDQLDQDDSRHDVENWDVEDDVLQAAVVKCNHMLSGVSHSADRFTNKLHSIRFEGSL